jgi:hypothetical protein
MVCVVKVVIFYTGGAKWDERFYQGQVASVKDPAFDSWAGERVLQNNTAVESPDGSLEVCM